MVSALLDSMRRAHVPVAGVVEGFDRGGEKRSRMWNLLRTRQPRRDSAPLEISVVVICFNMRREIVRTVRSLSAECQRGIDAADYEIVVVDNGSTPPLDPALFASMRGNVRVLHNPSPAVSPVSAVNLGLAQSRGRVIGVLIDGARMVTPGFLAAIRRASSLHPRPVIATLGFHLGPEPQMASVRKGYDQAAEDALLESIGWPSDGYRLFEISVLALSSAHGWFGPLAESNGLFMPRALWDELEGYDAAFVSPGGGLVNLDTYVRACALDGAQVFRILGEGTFHQVHGGVTTNAEVHPWDAFHDEYVAVRGKPFQSPAPPAWYFGTAPKGFERHMGVGWSVPTKT